MAQILQLVDWLNPIKKTEHDLTMFQSYLYFPIAAMGRFVHPPLRFPFSKTWNRCWLNHHVCCLTSGRWRYIAIDNGTVSSLIYWTERWWFSSQTLSLPSGNYVSLPMFTGKFPSCLPAHWGRPTRCLGGGAVMGGYCMCNASRMFINGLPSGYLT